MTGLIRLQCHNAELHRESSHSPKLILVQLHRQNCPEPVGLGGAQLLFGHSSRGAGNPCQAGSDNK